MRRIAQAKWGNGSGRSLKKPFPLSREGSWTSVSCVRPYEEVEEPVEVLGAGAGAGAGVTSVVREDAAPLNVAA